MKLHRALMSVVVLGLCSGCAGTGASYIPIIDGPKDSFFRTDLGACQQLAMERDVLNPDTKTDALIGGIAGGILGLLENGKVEEAAGGAVIGAVIGSADSSYDVIEERKGIIKRCMLSRGHNVVG